MRLKVYAIIQWIKSFDISPNAIHLPKLFSNISTESTHRLRLSCAPTLRRALILTLPTFSPRFELLLGGLFIVDLPLSRDVYALFSGCLNCLVIELSGRRPTHTQTVYINTHLVNTYNCCCCWSNFSRLAVFRVCAPAI